MRLRRIDDGHLTTECGSCELRRREDGRWTVDGRVVDTLAEAARAAARIVENRRTEA
jgi:hypothetical protein